MKSDLERAAEILDEYAQLLTIRAVRDSRAGRRDHGEWIGFDHIDREAGHDHDEYRALANRLRKMQA